MVVGLCIDYCMGLEKACSACGAKLLWKAKIFALRGFWMGSTRTCVLGNRSPTPSWSTSAKWSAWTSSTARTRKSIFETVVRETSHPQCWSLVPNQDLRPKSIPQLAHLRAYDIAVPHSSCATQVLIAKEQMLLRWLVTKRSEFVMERGFSTLRHRHLILATRAVNARKPRRKNVGALNPSVYGPALHV